MRHLIWKQWHEQAWKLGFGCVVLSAIAGIGLHARIVPDAAVVQSIAWVAAVLLPVLTTAGLFPAERADGTFETLLALPIPPGRILAANVYTGVVLCVGPIAAAAVVTALIAGGREVPLADLLAIDIEAAATAVVLLVWMMCLTAALPTEARAALVCVGVLVIWAILSIPLGASDVRWAAFPVSPFAFLYQFDDHPKPLWLLVIVAVQAVVLGVTLWITRRTFARITEGRS